MRRNHDNDEQNLRQAPAGERGQVGLMPGIAALAILLGTGLVAVIPAGAAGYPGLGWVEVSGAMGVQALSRAEEPCPLGPSYGQGLSPICAMPLD